MSASTTASRSSDARVACAWLSGARQAGRVVESQILTTALGAAEVRRRLNLRAFCSARSRTALAPPPAPAEPEKARRSPGSGSGGRRGGEERACEELACRSAPARAGCWCRAPPLQEYSLAATGRSARNWQDAKRCGFGRAQGGSPRRARVLSSFLPVALLPPSGSTSPAGTRPTSPASSW